jgi:membrane protease YdiL (CAAX protease family)
MHISSLAAASLAGVIAFGLPLIGPFERRIYRSDPRTPAKIIAYGATMALLWILTAAAVGIEGLARLFENPTAGEPWLWIPPISGVALSLLVAAYMIAGLMPMVQSLRGSRWRTAYAAAIRRNFSEIPGMLPNNATERAAWILLSFSAGICEEVLCRSFLIRFLRDSVGGMPLFGALVASSLIFGLAHLYQGAKGILGTAIGGLALGALYLLSGSLVPSIILHVLLDLQMAYILRPVPREAALAA